MNSLLRTFLPAVLCLTWIGPVLLGQSAGPNGRPPTAVDSKPTVPSPDQLRRFGLVASAAEAVPLLEQLTSEKEKLFEERRAALVSMQGKTPEEKLKIWQTLIDAQRERRTKHRELEHRLGAIQKLEREEKLLERKKQLPPKASGNGS